MDNLNTTNNTEVKPMNYNKNYNSYLDKLELPEGTAQYEIDIAIQNSQKAMNTYKGKGVCGLADGALYSGDKNGEYLLASILPVRSSRPSDKGWCKVYLRNAEGKRHQIDMKDFFKALTSKPNVKFLVDFDIDKVEVEDFTDDDSSFRVIRLVIPATIDHLSNSFALAVETTKTAKEHLRSNQTQFKFVGEVNLLTKHEASSWIHPTVTYLPGIDPAPKAKPAAEASKAALTAPVITEAEIPAEAATPVVEEATEVVEELVEVKAEEGLDWAEDFDESKVEPSFPEENWADAHFRKAQEAEAEAKAAGGEVADTSNLW